MRCPHCGVTVHDDFKIAPISMINSIENIFLEKKQIKYMDCPACGQTIIFLQSVTGLLRTEKIMSESLVYPDGATRIISDLIPKNLADDYSEANSILYKSPQASAALSRRCLQTFIREYGEIKGKNLEQEIAQLLNRSIFPPDIADSIDAIRNIGNFAAHPSKSQHTGEIVPVEPHEAEWCLDVLEAMFHFYFVKRAEEEERRKKLNQKLAAIDKPALKQAKENDSKIV